MLLGGLALLLLLGVLLLGRCALHLLCGLLLDASGFTILLVRGGATCVAGLGGSGYRAGGHAELYAARALDACAGVLGAPYSWSSTRMLTLHNKARDTL